MILALFDFDGTLVEGDTLLPFIRTTVGSGRFAHALLLSAPAIAGFLLGLKTNSEAKEILLAHAWRGRNKFELEQSGKEFHQYCDRHLIRTNWERFLQHKQSGHICLLVSASLDVYLKSWALKSGFDEVLCSTLAADSENRVTGILENGNCWGQEKLIRIQRWLGERRPERIYAYGDSRGDVAMLNFADEAWYKGKIYTEKK